MTRMDTDESARREQLDIDMAECAYAMLEVQRQISAEMGPARREGARLAALAVSLAATELLNAIWLDSPRAFAKAAENAGQAAIGALLTAERWGYVSEGGAPQ
jgi:hypothetical protein